MDSKSGKLWRQYIFALISSITVLLSGFVLGWTAPVNMKLKDLEQSPLPRVVTDDEESMIGALLTLGGLCGPFIGSFIAEKLGRKQSLIAISLPFLFGMILITIAKSVLYLYVGRFMWGIAVAMTFTVLPMYLVEIATINARGILASFLELFLAVGYFLAYAIGSYVSYHNFAYFGLAAIATCVSFYVLPESPRYLMMKNKTEAAAASLMVLRGRSRKEVEDEIAQITEEVCTSTSTGKGGKVSSLLSGPNLKVLLISSVLLLCQQSSGISPVLFFATNIFDAAGANVDKYVSTIIIGAVQILSSLASSMLVERLGRRILMLISSSGLAVGIFFIGLYFYLEEIRHPIVTSLGLLPVTSLAVYVIGYYIGMGPVVYTLINELLTMEVKAVASPALIALTWIVAFFGTRYFVPAANALGWYAVFWMFAAVSVFAFFFTLFMVPETKGKTAVEIQDMMAGRKSTSEKEEIQECNGVYTIRL